jgi:hypothetical protein
MTIFSFGIFLFYFVWVFTMALPLYRYSSSYTISYKDTNIISNYDYPYGQISPTYPVSGKWNGSLIPSHERIPFSIFFHYLVDSATNSVNGSVDIYRKDKRFEQIEIYVKLHGKIFKDSLYLTGDTTYDEYFESGTPKELYKRTVVRHLRFFTKCYTQGAKFFSSRFIQGVFIDSAQFKDGEGTRGNRCPPYGFFFS